MSPDERHGKIHFFAAGLSVKNEKVQGESPMKYKVRVVACLAFAAGLALVVRAEGEAPSTSTLAQNEEVLSNDNLGG